MSALVFCTSAMTRSLPSRAGFQAKLWLCSTLTLPIWLSTFATVLTRCSRPASLK
jgi:hypothetical protein